MNRVFFLRSLSRKGSSGLHCFERWPESSLPALRHHAETTSFLTQTPRIKELLGMFVRMRYPVLNLCFICLDAEQKSGGLWSFVEATGDWNSNSSVHFLIFRGVTVSDLIYLNEETWHWPVPCGSVFQETVNKQHTVTHWAFFERQDKHSVDC